MVLFFVCADVNECLPVNPCKNGGVCKNVHGSYQCTCVGKFYSGKNCDQGNASAVYIYRALFDDLIGQRFIPALYLVKIVENDEQTPLSVSRILFTHSRVAFQCDDVIIFLRGQFHAI